MPVQATARSLKLDTGQLIKAPRRMPVAEAVQKFMRVPTSGGNSVPWDPLVAPYVIEPMNCLSSREFDAVVFVGPARTGKTNGLIDGWVVYNIVCDPSDFLLVQMTQDKAKEHSKKRLARTFRCSPEVRKRLSPRSNDNNVHDKYFLSGSFLKIGWPSINVMSSSDFKCVALTDYDRFPEDIDGEGDGFSLASKRTTTFMSAGMTLVESSPGREITNSKWRRTSPHEAPPTTGILSLYNRGDRRRWYWPCPDCGDYFQPSMEAMTGYRDNPDPVKASEAAHILCPHCGSQITADMKRELNGRGVWLREGEHIDREGNVTGTPRHSRIASFWMEGPAAAYQTWAQLVYKLLTAEQEYEATGSEETLKAVINTDWGLPYLPRSALELRSADVLMQRAEDYGKRLVPPKVRFLIAAVDVQGGKNRRFVVQITGYGEDGVTDNAYKFWRKCRQDGLGRRIFLIKGDSTKRQKIITITHPDNTGRSDRRADAQGKVPVYLLQTDQLKDQLSNNLQRESPGPGYIHFPDWIGEWFYEELTYEERGADGKWRKPGKGNNEAFDLFCYAHAVAILRGYEKIRDWSNPPQWARGQDADAGASADKRSSGVADKKNVAGRDERREEASSEALSGNWLSLPRNGGWL